MQQNDIFICLIPFNLIYFVSLFHLQFNAHDLACLQKLDCSIVSNIGRCDSFIDNKKYSERRQEHREDTCVGIPKYFTFYMEKGEVFLCREEDL